MAYMLHSAVLRPVRLIRKLPAHDGIVRTCPIHHTAHINLHRNRPSISHIDRPAIVRKSEIQLLSHISMERCQRRIKRSILARMFSQIHQGTGIAYSGIRYPAYDQYDRWFTRQNAAVAPYYTTTLLANSVTPSAVFDLEARIDAYAILDPADIEAANDILYAEKVTGKQKQRLTFFLQKSKKLLEHYEYNDQRECVSVMRSFVRFYEFLLQVSSFEDTDLHKKYNFIAYLLSYINIKHPGGGFNLDGKIKASNFVQKKIEEHTTPNLVASPVMKLPTAEHFGLTEDKEKRLSEIIDEINSRTGKSYDNDVVVKAMLQIRDILMKSEKLKTSSKNNTQQDFEFSYFDDIDDALIEGLSQNQDFFSLLLSNDEMKRQVLGIFADEIYKSLRSAD